MLCQCGGFGRNKTPGEETHGQFARPQACGRASGRSGALSGRSGTVPCSMSTWLHTDASAGSHRVRLPVLPNKLRVSASETSLPL